ncbi:MAG: TonB dependent receptor [Caulobacter sp.]|nr:TonB dependent receptor [Caulobacter sp.]
MINNTDSRRARRLALMASAAALMAFPVLAQEAAPAPDSSAVEAVVVTGIRATQRSSAETKRTSAVVVDAIVNDEIGALPDQSVGETLERITGVAADRFKGSASEISVRGLGPFLGFSTLNGREVSSGGGDRTVSFQQFPSELVNGVLVYKTQSADFVEGGVSGSIELRTLRPLDYGKRRFQLDLRGVYNPYDDRVSGRDGQGFRGSASYIDQFETAIGDIGVSMGYSHTDSSQPEDFYTGSSSFQPCNTVNTTPTAVAGGGAATNCSYSAASTNPVYFVSNGYTFRQLKTDDNRDAFMGSLQWKPNADWNVNLDLQLSSRTSVENRHDLTLAEGRRGIAPIQIAANGALRRFQGNSTLENVATYRQRDENYTGGGLAVERKGDRLTVSMDASYSKTHRNQVDRSARLRSNTLFGAGGRVAYTFDQTTDIPSITFATPINLDDPNAYTTNGYARRQMEDRTDEISAIRFDGTYRFDGFIESVKGGVRYSDHHRVADLDNNNNIDPLPTATGAALMAAGNANCRTGFQQSDWGKGSGSNITSWATFDARCLYATFAGAADAGPLADSRSSSDIDMREKIAAAYLMANFRSELAGKPVSGNFGVRVVRTKVDSNGFRGAYTAVNSGGVFVLQPIAGTFDPVNIKNDFTNILPSVNVNIDLRDDVKLRLAVSKSLARPNIEDMGAGRDLIADINGTTVEDAIAGASGGNPRLEPLQSWNSDVSLEWYATPDTTVSAAVFYKQLKAGIVPAYDSALIESVSIDGRTYQIPVAQQTNSKQENWLAGLELTAQHAFSWLPSPFDGFGVVGSYTYADSDFEYEDPSAVVPTAPLRDFTDPANVIGLSKYSGSATLYWEKYGASIRAVYKYRAGYFKPSGLTANRFVDDSGYMDVSASYDLNKHVQLKFQASNILSDHQVMWRPVAGSVAESSYFGPSYQLGVRFRY